MLPVTILLMRHAERGPLPADSPGHSTPITERGQEVAAARGAALGPDLRSISCSPVLRCRQTAEALVLGVGRPLDVRVNPLLGAEGAILTDPRAAWQSYCSMDLPTLVRTLADGGAVPGFALVAESVPRMVRAVVDECRATPGTHVFVTHDIIVALTALFYLRLAPDPALWPDFLEATTIVLDGNAATIAYREHRGPLSLP